MAGSGFLRAFPTAPTAACAPSFTLLRKLGGVSSGIYSPALNLEALGSGLRAVAAGESPSQGARSGPLTAPSPIGPSPRAVAIAAELPAPEASAAGVTATPP